ncbi:MAG: hypothetical protein ACRDRO_21415 [Pseudonocardiaceae bacterium]
MVAAEWAAARLLGEQAQVVAVQRGLDPSPPGGPVVVQVGVVRRRRACDHLVPDDGCPGELDQVWDAAPVVYTGAVLEHPSVVPELVEPAEVAVGDLVIVWHLLSDPQAHFHDLGPDFYDNRTGPERKKCNHIRQFEALGYKVTLEPTA